MSPLISVIIPVLNEEHFLSRALESCQREGADEIIVVDGGSTDRTLEVLQGYGITPLTVDRPQRSTQLNRGGQQATGELLVFLHADSTLERGALEALKQVAHQPAIVGGGFFRTFGEAPAVVALAGSLGNQRGRVLGWYFGDQAIWCRRRAFLEVGGYPDQLRFEDLDFCRRLKRQGLLAQVSPGIQTSTRRFHPGPLRRVILDFLLTLRHMLTPRGH